MKASLILIKLICSSHTYVLLSVSQISVVLSEVCQKLLSSPD